MTDELQKMMAQMIEQGQAMARAMGVDPENLPPMPKMSEWMPTMSAEMMEAFMGKGASPNGLDAKTKLLLTLGALTIFGAKAEDQITLTVRHLRVLGATEQEIFETITQMGGFGGVPAMTRAMELAKAEISKTGSAQK